MEGRIKNLEKRMDRVEKVLKLSQPRKSIPVKCVYCGWTMNVTSKQQKISCSSCGNKTKNTSLKDEKGKI